jgi:hypothetical protein
MADLSVLIPARNEIFLAKTIENVLDNIEGDTEVIAICDGYWPDPRIADHPRVVLVHHTVPIGQRAGTNEAARLSQAKFIMKLDAHCAVDKGFDVKLMADCEYDWTVIPRMYNLHAFDWVCSCGHRMYQGPTPEKCPSCGVEGMVRELVWKPRSSRVTDFARFDRNLHFQYWHTVKTCDQCHKVVERGKAECPSCRCKKFTIHPAYDSRPQAQGDIADVMCHVGAAWFMHRERYWELGGLDEGHGSWGQMGVEVSCKTWLSGGRQVVNKKTWFAHMFRTQGGDFSFPYPLTNKEVDKAREHSKSLWINGAWPKAKYPLSWLVDKFAPVPEWG